MKKTLIPIILLLVTVACQSNEPVIIKKDAQPYVDGTEIDEEITESQSETIVEITLPEENVQLNIQMIPILNEYLSLARDKTSVLNEISLYPLHANEHKHYLLEFACHNNLCSYLIIDENETHSSLLVADLAKYDDALYSPDESLLAIKFERDDLSSLPLGHVVVIDLEQWTPVHLKNINDTTQSLHFQTPILSVSWIDDTTISMQIPTISELNEKNISTWESTEGLTTDLIFQIEK